MAWTGWKSDGESILVGALASTTTRVWTAFSDSELWAIWGHREDTISLSVKVQLDPIWIHSGPDAFDLHVDYTVSAEYNEVPQDGHPPVGWATWYTFYEHIDEKVLLVILRLPKI